MPSLKPRLRASAIHLAISLSVATLAALVVFGWWYPYPYRELSGGRELFALVVVVDVVLGPLITLVIFNVAKTRRHLMMDFTVIGLLQVAALAYGLWTVFVARPVHLVFEELNGVRLQLIYLHCTTRSASRGPSLVKMAHSGPSQLLHVTDLACYSATCNDFPGEFHGFIRCSTGSKAAFGDAHGGASPCPNLGA